MDLQKKLYGTITNLQTDGKAETYTLEYDFADNIVGFVMDKIVMRVMGGLIDETTRIDHERRKIVAIFDFSGE